MDIQGQDKEPKYSLWLAALGYLFFVVYGSLLPFDFNQLPLAAGWTKFQAIPWLYLGVGSRADWVANLLLYIPLGFLVCALLVGRSRQPAVLVIGLALSLLMAVTLAIGVEFTQEFFPPRTVSLNDLLAESVGSFVGIVLWLMLGPRLMALMYGITQGGAQAWRSFLVAYALLYVALALFPYDFLLSADEWQAKWASGKVAWLFATDCGYACALKLIPEAFGVLPLGLLAALIYRADKRLPLLTAASLGLLLGVLIEGLQLTIDTGISQGASILSRGVGVMLGAGALRLAAGFDWRRWGQWLRGLIAVAALPYLLIVAGLNHWLKADWLEQQVGLARLPDIHFLPFYYHYFTSESAALVSLLYQFAMYVPVSIALWLWRWSAKGRRDGGAVLAMLLAGLLASTMEAGKLFIVGQHPDPSNVLIAIVAAWSAHVLLGLLSKAPVPDAHHEALSAQNKAPKSKPDAVVAAPSRAKQFFGVLALCIAVGSTWVHPLGMLPALLCLSIFAVLLWLRPSWWLPCLLGLLPILDFAPWSGRLFWSEFDTALMACLGVMYLRQPLALSGRVRLSGLGKVLLAAFIISAVLGLCLGLWPLKPIDANAFTGYTSPYNALRAAKALFFALVCLPLLRFEMGNRELAARRIALGMSLGLTAEVIYVLWERATFSGLFNFATDFRITGSFPFMHIGGAYIEAYLVTALPFALLLAWQTRRMAVTALMAVLYLLGAYSVMVTFSRGGQAAFVLATIIAVAGFSLRNQGQRLRAVAAMLLISVAAFAVAWPIFTGKFSQSRMATTSKDVVTRMDHWADALQILQQRKAMLLGAGLGSFPAEYYWGSRAPSRPSTYAFLAERGNPFLRLGSGETLYFEQPVAVDNRSQYTLAMDLRGNVAGATLTAPLCEKALLYSFACAWVTLNLHPPQGQWAHYEVKIDPSRLNTQSRFFPRPIKLALVNDRQGSLVDIDNISLRDAGGQELIANGDFSAGMARWFFSTDSHLAWHVKNLFVHVWFEQGLLGLVIFVALVIYAMLRLARAAWQGDALGLTLFAALAAFIAVGLIDSLVDETRLGFLFYLLLLVGLMLPKGAALHPGTRR